jgi:hypothetical protein
MGDPPHYLTRWLGGTTTIVMSTGSFAAAQKIEPFDLAAQLKAVPKSRDVVNSNIPVSYLIRGRMWLR